METLKRCPACHLPPLLVSLPNGYVTGGCQSAHTQLCINLSHIVLQPDREQAIAQWNDLADKLIGTFIAQEAA